MGKIVLEIQRQSSKTFLDNIKEIPRKSETKSLSYEQKLVDGDMNEIEMEEELSKHQKEVAKIVLRRIVLIGFVVWDIKEDRPLPIILRKPFDTISHALLDLERGELFLHE